MPIIKPESGGDQAMNVKDLTPLYKKYKGQWVALKDDEVSVISHGIKAQVVWQAAVDKGYKNPILFKVPTRLTSYVGYAN